MKPHAAAASLERPWPDAIDVLHAAPRYQVGASDLHVVSVEMKPSTKTPR